MEIRHARRQRLRGRAQTPRDGQETSSSAALSRAPNPCNRSGKRGPVTHGDLEGCRGDLALGRLGSPAPPFSVKPPCPSCFRVEKGGAAQGMAPPLLPFERGDHRRPCGSSVLKKAVQGPALHSRTPVRRGRASPPCGAPWSPRVLSSPAWSGLQLGRRTTSSPPTTRRRSRRGSGCAARPPPRRARLSRRSSGTCTARRATWRGATRRSRRSASTATRVASCSSWIRDPR